MAEVGQPPCESLFNPGQTLPHDGARFQPDQGSARRLASIFVENQRVVDLRQSDNRFHRL